MEAESEYDRRDRTPRIGANAGGLRPTWISKIDLLLKRLMNQLLAGTRSSAISHCYRLDYKALNYFTVDAEGLLSDRPSIKTMFLALSIFRSCMIFFTRVHSPSVK